MRQTCAAWPELREDEVLKRPQLCTQRFTAGHSDVAEHTVIQLLQLLDTALLVRVAFNCCKV
jgi:hypothetical protein